VRMHGRALHWVRSQVLRSVVEATFHTLYVYDNFDSFETVSQPSIPTVFVFVLFCTVTSVSVC